MLSQHFASCVSTQVPSDNCIYPYHYPLLCSFILIHADDLVFMTTAYKNQTQAHINKIENIQHETEIILSQGPPWVQKYSQSKQSLCKQGSRRYLRGPTHFKRVARSKKSQVRYGRGKYFGPVQSFVPFQFEKHPLHNPP